MLPSGKEVFAGLFGAYRLARLDPQGMGFFDLTVAGFWNSFFAAVLVLPSYILVLALRTNIADLPDDLFSIVLIEALSYVVLWLLFPVVAHAIAVTLDKEDRFIPLVVASNWAAVVQMVIYLPVLLVGDLGLVPVALAKLLDVVGTAVVIAYRWYVIRIAFATGALGALGLVFIELMLELMLFSITSAFLGLAPAT